jgi:hypothetical protein
MYRRPDFVADPPPTPALLFGQLAFTLAVFVLIAVLSVWHRPAPCDGMQGSTAFIQHALSGKAGPDVASRKISGDRDR